MSDTPTTTPPQPPNKDRPFSTQQKVTGALVAAGILAGAYNTVVPGERRAYKGPPDAIIRFRGDKPPVVRNWRPNRRDGDALQDVAIFLDEEALERWYEGQE